MVADRSLNRYDSRMQPGARIRGRLRGRVIELDEPVDGIEEGEVEVDVRPAQSATPRPADVLEVIASLPEGSRTKADIDQRLAEDRSGWAGRG
jgi:hypothetical protein